MTGVTIDPRTGATAAPGPGDLVRRVGAALAARRALVDLAFAAVLVTIALVGFRTGFLGWEWVLAAGAGLVLGLAIAWLGAVRRWPVLLTALLVVAVYFLLGGPLAVRDKLIGGVLPSLSTFVDLAVASVTGWKRWLTLLPPVDARGPLVALPWLTGLVGGALTFGVARRWRSAPVVVVAPLVLLVGSIALGTMQPAAKWVQGVLFALVLILWVVVRSARNRAVMQNGAGRRARLATGAALLAVAALAAGGLAPYLPGARDGDVRQVVRTTLVPPYDVAQFSSPLAGFRRYTEPNQAALFDKTILTVTGLPAGTPVRFASLDRYDGLVWGAADRTADGVPFQQVGSRIAARSTGEEASATVTVAEDGYTGAWLPTAGSPTAISFTGARADRLADQLWLNTDTETAVVPATLTGGESYRMSAILPRTPALTALPADLDVATGASTPTDTSFLDAKIDAWTSNAGSTWEKFAAAARYMSTNGAYTDGGTPNSFEKVYLPGHGLARLGRFVGSTQLAGNDEQYAATLALVGQRLGIPTRVVMGAIPQADGAVKGKDVHAWVEVKKDDGEWVGVLPQTFLPDRNKKPNEQQLKTEEQKVGAQVPPPAGTNPPSVLQGPDQAQNATDLTKRKKNPFDPSGWPFWLQLLVFALLVPLLVLAALYALIRWLKARRRTRHAVKGAHTARVAWVWRDLVTDARTMGVSIPTRRTTRLEQAAAFPVPGPAREVAAGADALVFGPEELDDEGPVALLARADAVRSELRAGLTRWRRLRSDISLRPFLDRRTPWRRPSLPRATLARTKKVATSS
jgi:hypothetical protein